MMGVQTPEMPENFGVLLDSKNIDANLAAWRVERDGWIAQHPDAVEHAKVGREPSEWRVLQGGYGYGNRGRGIVAC